MSSNNDVKVKEPQWRVDFLVMPIVYCGVHDAAQLRMRRKQRDELSADGRWCPTDPLRP